MTADDVLRPYQTYLDGLAKGQLLFERCGECGAAVFYPRVVCNSCGSENLTFEGSGGLGTVYSTTAITNREKPSYSVTLVDLDEGFRVMSTVLGIVAEEIAIGMRVKAGFEPAEADKDARLVFFPEAQIV
jgi:uncharacterized OB-fold protein